MSLQTSESQTHRLKSLPSYQLPRLFQVRLSIIKRQSKSISIVIMKSLHKRTYWTQLNKTLESLLHLIRLYSLAVHQSRQRPASVIACMVWYDHEQEHDIGVDSDLLISAKRNSNQNEYPNLF
jgi:hypothetical protein